MPAPAQVAIPQRENEGLRGRGRQAAHPEIEPGYGQAWRSHFSEIIGSASALIPQNAADLTDRECTILQLLSDGFSNKEAAKSLGISPETVKSHVKNIFQKLSVDRRAQAVSRALRLGVIMSG